METVPGTLTLLEARLQRLEHFLHNPSTAVDVANVREDREVNGGDVVDRLRKLESRTADAIASNKNAGILSRLYADLPELGDEHAGSRGPDNDVDAKLSIVLSSATAYSEMVSQLDTLQQYPVPNPAELKSLLTHALRLEKFEAMQNTQLQQVQQLRQRSAELVAQWYQAHVLKASRQWSDWEERMMHAEQTARRHEATRARENDMT